MPRTGLPDAAPLEDIRGLMRSGPMRAELRSLDYFESDLSSIEGEAFCINVTATIGAVGERGGDDFTLEVCSPAWLQAELESDQVVSGQYRLIMEEFDFPLLERFVAKRVGQTEGPDWLSVAKKLAAWSCWEFEGLPPPQRPLTIHLVTSAETIQPRSRQAATQLWAPLKLSGLCPRGVS